MKNVICSIIMPAYNSQRTIECVLRSIQMQTIANHIEIIVVDGGSRDRTTEIAQKYGAIVLNNPERVPEVAKRIGLQHAKGKYAIWEDTDEELTKADQLERRIRFMEKHSRIKCMVCDEQHPGPNSGIAGSYLCYCGDPFSNFVYKRRNGVVHTFEKNIAYREEDGIIFKFKNGDATPIGDGGTTIFDLNWVKQTFPEEWNTQAFVCGITDQICRRTKRCGCIPGDNIIHHARADYRTYLKKLKFRVVNNVFDPEKSGYSARTSGKKCSEIALRKYLYVLYSATIVLPLFDSVLIAIRNKDVRLLLHFVYNNYVVYEIAVNVLIKKLGKKKTNQAY